MKLNFPTTAPAAPVVLDGFTLVQDLTASQPAQALVPVQATAIVPHKFVQVTDEHIDNLGVKSSQSTSKISQEIMAGARASDIDSFGAKLNELVVTTKGLDPKKMGEPGLIGRIFGAAGRAKEKLLSEYQSVETRMNALILELENMAALMDKRVVDLETMHKDNTKLYQVLGEEITQGDALVQSMQASYDSAPAPTDPLEAQQRADYQSKIHRLAKRVDDLRRGQQLILMSLPEIRLEQDNKRALSSSVRTVKTTTIPAYQGVFSRYILAMETKKGNEIINAVYDATDEAFRQQADLVRQNAADAAQIQQRSVVSLETLTHCRDQLLGALDDVKRIADEGRAAREAARPELEKLEQGLIARFSAPTQP